MRFSLFNTCRPLATTLTVLLGLAMLGGCHARSFFDQSEVGRFPERGSPLLVPILETLDTGYDEGDTRFVTATSVRPKDLQPVSADYVINRNDALFITITNLVIPGGETYKQVRVSETGNISLPYIRQLKAAGLTEAQLEEAINQAYRDLNLVQDAQASVSVQEARGRTFTITGSIAAPGQYAIYDSNFRVLDALALARGVTTPVGIENIYVVRKLEQEPDEQELAPELMPAPATQPAEDVLTPPQGRATPLRPDSAAAREAEIRQARRIALLKTQPQDPDPAIAQPEPAPATEPAGEREGRIIVIEGQPVQMDGTPATEPQPTEPMVEPMETQPATQPFEFNELNEPGDLRIIRVPYESLQRGELRYNIVIRPQDMIIVPDPVIGEYYIGGHVQRTGVYSLTGRRLTLSQAIIAAGMLDQIAVPWRTQIKRRIGPREEIIVGVNVTRIFAGQEPDVYLKPYDQIIVGTDFWAPWFAALRNGFRITYGFGFLYDRNYADEDEF